MTLGLVAAGAIIGIFEAWAIGAASRDRPEDTSPRSAITLSREISFLTAVADWPGIVWLSSVRSSIFRPSTPPAALAASTAIVIPSCEDWPKLASLPVNEANSPTLMVSSARSAPAARPTPRARRGRARRVRAWGVLGIFWPLL